jgi:hypothetical protein
MEEILLQLTRLASEAGRLIGVIFTKRIYYKSTRLASEAGRLIYSR